MAIQETHRVRSIGKEELKARIDRKEKFRLWNVLDREYYMPDKNIPGSIWIPVDEFERKVRREAVDRDEPVVTYCGGGGCPASRQAAEMLVSRGFKDVAVYEGGVREWSEAGYPMVQM